MSTQQIGTRLAQLCNEGRSEDAVTELSPTTKATARK